MGVIFNKGSIIRGGNRTVGFLNWQTDPYYNYTTLLLSGNGANTANNSSFVDSSTNNFAITRNGNVAVGTLSPYSNLGWSTYFNGSSYISTTGFNFAAANFTIELFVNTNSLTAGPQFISGYASTNQNYAITLETGGVFKYYLSSNGSGWDIVNGVTLGTGVVGRWHHIAIARSGSSIRGFFDGTGGTLTTSSSSIFNNATAFYMGAAGSAGGNLTGYMSSVRVLNGITAYDPASTSITVPTFPLAEISPSTALLTLQDNRFRDASVNNLTLTLSGSPAINSFSPFISGSANTTIDFNPFTSTRSLTTNGGSAYFDGSGDYLTVGASSQIFPTGTQTYSVEFWAYPISLTTATYPIFCQNATSGGWQIAYFNDGGANQNKIGIGIYGTVPIGTATFNTYVNQWVHVVATRTGNDHRLFINGILQIYVNNSVSFASLSGASQQIGSPDVPQTYMTGLRTFLGSIPTNYQTSSTTTGTSIFTPPTAPLTAVANTSLLLNFTNAGIPDFTRKNNLETLGDAQVSTVQSKWGGSSIYSSGISSYLICDANNLQSLPGDFTMEAWVYPIDAGRSADANKYGTILSGGSNGVSSPEFSWFLRIVSTNVTELFFQMNSSVVLTVSGLSYPINTWYHFAVVRSGTGTGNLNLYVNGSSVATSAGAVTTAVNFTGGAQKLWIARNAGSAFGLYQNWLQGYFQDVRITKFARTITLPTSQFPKGV